MTTTNKQQQEVDRNFEAFEKMLPDLLEEHANRFALLEDGKLIACFDTSRDAIEVGRKFSKNGLFSIQEISSKPIDLGYFSHAGILRTV